MTRMYGDFPARQGISVGSVAEGYYPTTNFTIMQALYYMSYISEATPDLPETPANGVAGQVFLPGASIDTADPAPTIRQPSAIAPMPGGQRTGHGYGYGGGVGEGYQQGIGGDVQILGGYERADYFQYHKGVDYSCLKFEAWKPETSLGQKTWVAQTFPDEETVVLKLWDGRNFDTEARDREVAIYLHIKSLVGVYVPALRVCTAIEFFHGLILQYVKVKISSVIRLMIRDLLFRHRILQLKARRKFSWLLRQFMHSGLYMAMFERIIF